MDFIEISNIIFENRNKYHLVLDSDKINAFYIINKKLLLGSFKDKSGNKKELYNICQLLNNKNIQRDSALDLWYLFFRNINQKTTPGWWFTKNPNKKEEKIKDISKSDKQMLMEYDGLSEKDFEFLCEHYRDDVDYRIKILNRV